MYLNRVLVLESCCTWPRSWGRHLAMSLYKLWHIMHIYLNWIMLLRATACLHCHCIDDWPARHRMTINLVQWGRCHVNTAAHYYVHYWAGLTWLLFLWCVLSLRRSLPFNTDGRETRTGKRTLACKSPAPICEARGRRSLNGDKRKSIWKSARKYIVLAIYKSNE